jgi:hypothetical protein
MCLQSSQSSFPSLKVELVEVGTSLKEVESRQKSASHWFHQRASGYTAKPQICSKFQLYQRICRLYKAWFSSLSFVLKVVPGSDGHKVWDFLHICTPREQLEFCHLLSLQPQQNQILLLVCKLCKNQKEG